MAADFLGVGKTIEQKQNRLNAACSAWNMACGSPEVRQRQLDRYREGYLRSNPETFPADLAKSIKDMEALIASKLKMFPDDHRQIVSARAVMVGNAYRIDVTSATLPLWLGKGQHLEIKHDIRRQAADSRAGPRETPEGSERLPGGQ